MSKYDNVEIHPVVGLDAKGNPVEANKDHIETRNPICSFEQCEENDPNLFQWSVYLHLVAGGVTCIADCPTKRIANTIAEILKSNLDKLQTIEDDKPWTAEEVLKREG